MDPSEMKMSHPGNCMQVHREFTAGMPKHACTCFLELITLLGGQGPLQKWIFSSSRNRSKVSFCASILTDPCSTQYCVLKWKTHFGDLLRPHVEWRFSGDVLSTSKGSHFLPSGSRAVAKQTDLDPKLHLAVFSEKQPHAYWRNLHTFSGGYRNLLD